MFIFSLSHYYIYITYCRVESSFLPLLYCKITSLLKGEKLLTGSTSLDTKNALGKVNGKQIMATPDQIQLLKEHIRTYVSPYRDIRDKIREVEATLFTDYSGFLIGNQTLDFQKQDGITEVEEAIMANTVERRLNDLLLHDEAAGMVVVNRQPIYVSCVSNFTNFLDLSRKTLRSLEVGVPCVVLGRSNTSQHAYRWTELLVRLCKEHDVDPGMITFLSCELDDIIDITQSCIEHTGNLYTTCSRQLAAQIMSTYPKTVASTGGPNTLVATELTGAVREAIQMSASIECSGQCTALRHCVVPPSTDNETLEGIFDSLRAVPSASDAVQKSLFDGVFKEHGGSGTPDESTYKHHEQVDAFFKISDEFPEDGINEYWRKVVVDFSKVDVRDEAQLDRLAAWLNKNQPISLAVNGPRKESISLLLKLFTKTGMVVNTVGSTDAAEMPPALTCQARPQEGEVFGEFPPRSELQKYTKFPVVVPSSNPSYDAQYSEEYLCSLNVDTAIIQTTRALLEEVKDGVKLGFCLVLIEYLRNAARFNPKHGLGTSRTALWGLQRPPIGTFTYIHCSAYTTWDDVAPSYIIFHATNARDQIKLVIDSSNKELIELCNKHGLPHMIDTPLAELASRTDVFNIVEAKPLESYPMAGNYVSLFLPLGHIKSTMPKDEEFMLRARISEKWLNTLF